MSDPYIGEIRMFAGNFAPVGWLFCNGELLAISDNEVLFQLIGTTYGGDGESTFALPNLQSRVPIHQGNGAVIGQPGGSEEVTLTTNTIPAHTHVLQGSTEVAQQSGPANQVLGRTTAQSIYGADTPYGRMAATAIGPIGGGQPHENVQPFQCVNYIISLFGIYPTQT